jgi:hypothetical protein
MRTAEELLLRKFGVEELFRELGLDGYKQVRDACVHDSEGHKDRLNPSGLRRTQRLRQSQPTHQSPRL